MIEVLYSLYFIRRFYFVSGYESNRNVGYRYKLADDIFEFFILRLQQFYCFKKFQLLIFFDGHRWSCLFIKSLSLQLLYKWTVALATSGRTRPYVYRYRITKLAKYQSQTAISTTRLRFISRFRTFNNKCFVFVKLRLRISSLLDLGLWAITSLQSSNKP